jgi:hypothetical protein
MVLKWRREQSAEIVNFLSDRKSKKSSDTLLGQTNAWRLWLFTVSASHDARICRGHHTFFGDRTCK